jgi:hypothetical protein
VALATSRLDPTILDMTGISHEQAGLLAGGARRAIEVALYLLASDDQVRIGVDGAISLVAGPATDTGPGPAGEPVEAAIRAVLTLRGGRVNPRTLFTEVAGYKELQDAETRLSADGLRRPWSGKLTHAGNQRLVAYLDAHEDEPVAAVVMEGWAGVPEDGIREPLLAALLSRPAPGRRLGAGKAGGRGSRYADGNSDWTGGGYSG